MGFQFVKTAKVRGVMPFYKQKGKTSKLFKEVFESNTIATGRNSQAVIASTKKAKS